MSVYSIQKSIEMLLKMGWHMCLITSIDINTFVLVYDCLDWIGYVYIQHFYYSLPNSSYWNVYLYK